MASRGELVEFKPGLFGLGEPNNFGIFVKSSKRKKGVFVQLYTLKGIRETKQNNLYKAKFGYFVQLKGGSLPPEKELKERLSEWIKLVQTERGNSGAGSELGALTERTLWDKLIRINPNRFEYTTEEMTKIWYESDEVSRTKVRKIQEALKPCTDVGFGHFTLINSKEQKWRLLSQEEKKSIGKEIALLGTIRNKLFVFVEEADEENPEEKITVRKSVPWNDISFNDDELKLVSKLQKIMSHFIEFDNWGTFGLAGTRKNTIDGFDLHKLVAYLAEDWVNEGRTTIADSFVKFLLNTAFIGQDEALVKISKRAVNLAPDFSWETPENIEEAARRFEEPKETPEVFEGRLDLRKMEAYTIDPPTAKDFDDAVTVLETDKGFELWVHIADVAHYVEKYGLLDKHAQQRATSVYLPTKVLPMLPTHLSDNLCSLRDTAPRLAMSVKIPFDKSGKREGDEEVYNTVIQVTKNLSYDYVNDAISKQVEPFISYHKLATLINNNRRSLNLETPEVKLHLGEKMSIAIKTSSASTKMIETFMVSANEAIGNICLRAEVPAIYRIHPLPEREKIIKFNGQLKVVDLQYEIDYPEKLFENNEDIQEEEDPEEIFRKLKEQGGFSGGGISISFGGGSSLGDQLKQKEKTEEVKERDIGTPLAKGLAQLSPEKQEEVLRPFIKILSEVEKMTDEELQRLVYLLVLRVFPQALYSAGNIGHFGLGSLKYIHFTSPIRRYPDIIAHRICKQLILEKNGTGKSRGDELVYQADEIEELALHCTDQSITATNLERQIVAAGYSFLAKNESFENRNGIVSSVFGGYVSVLLPNGIEARIPIRKMTDRPTFIDDFESMCFVGSRDKFDMTKEITPENYKELLQDDNEIVEVLAQLGDKIAISFDTIDHIEGNILALPIRITRKDHVVHDFEAEKETEIV